MKINLLFSPEVGEGGGVAAVTLCLSHIVSRIPEAQNNY